jgi:hypothetical protein
MIWVLRAQGVTIFRDQEKDGFGFGHKGSNLPKQEKD